MNVLINVNRVAGVYGFTGITLQPETQTEKELLIKLKNKKAVLTATDFEKPKIFDGEQSTVEGLCFESNVKVTG